MTSQTQTSEQEAPETFDDIVTSDSGNENTAIDYDPKMEDWSQPISAKGPKGKIEDQVARLEADEDGVVTGKDKEEKKDEDKDKETGEEVKKAEKKTEEKPKPVGKLIKAKVGENEVEIDTGAVIRHKVDGQMVEVKISDLLNTYSGETSYNKKFQEVAAERKQLEAEKQRTTQVINNVKSHMENIVKLAKDPEAHPLDSINYILDMVGENTVEYQKKAYQALSEEFETLMTLDEAEKKAYWLEKELDQIRKRDAKMSETTKSQRIIQERISKTDKVREQLGVDEDEYVDSLEELIEAGHSKEDLLDAPDKVAGYAVRRRHFQPAAEMLEPFENNMGDAEYDALLREVIESLVEDPNSLESIREELQRQFGVDPDLKSLTEKAQTSRREQAEIKPTRRNQEGLETWEDFEF